MKKLLLIAMLMLSASCFAQQYTGLNGLIHVPSAEMDTVGEARIGSHFLNGEFLPDQDTWYYHGDRYNTFDFYISLTPFKWVELAYTITLIKHEAKKEGDRDGDWRKDRYFSIKLRPLEEGKYWPAVAIGANDFLSSDTFKTYKSRKSNNYWGNIFVALTKHFDFGGNELAPTLVYRRFVRAYNHRWDGVVGGLTYRPSFARNWRAIVEWTGCDVNFGVDCCLWKHLLLQASLQGGKYPSAGVCYMVNLF